MTIVKHKTTLKGACVMLGTLTLLASCQNKMETLESASSASMNIKSSLKGGADDSGPFDATCYLARYPDVAADASARANPLRHYNAHGKAEGRKGGCGVANSQVLVSIQPKKFAGSVTNVVWNNKEFINIHDHGRQLQSAIQIDGYSECNNPTEAGSEFDGTGPTSSSVVQSLAYNDTNRSMSVETQMAYFYWQQKSNTPQGGACPLGFDPRANTATSNQNVYKEVILDAFGDPQIVQFNLTFKLAPGSHKVGIVYEYLTGYLTSEFDNFFYYKPAQNKLVQMTSSDMGSLVGNGFPNGSLFAKAPGKDTNDPVVFSTQDQKYAMGVVTDPKNFTSCGAYFRGYDVYKFNLGGSGPTGNGTTKWSLSTVDDSDSKCIVNNKRSFTVYLIMGDVAQVQAKMKTVYDRLNGVASAPAPAPNVPAPPRGEPAPVTVVPAPAPPVSVPATPTPPVSSAAISEGAFKVGTTYYYSNGGAYCKFGNQAVFQQVTSRSDVESSRVFGAIPSAMRNDNICTVAVASNTPVPEGLFVVGVNLYYSNGGAYCYFPTMDVYTRLTGRKDIQGLRQLSIVPAVMKYDGLCQ